MGVYPGGIDTDFYRESHDYVSLDKQHTFMPAADLAGVMLDNLLSEARLTVSDILIDACTVDHGIGARQWQAIPAQARSRRHRVAVPRAVRGTEPDRMVAGGHHIRDHGGRGAHAEHRVGQCGPFARGVKAESMLDPHA